MGWCASCPILGYSRTARFAPGDLIDRLRRFAAQSDHEFWPDEISLRDEKIFAAERLHHSRQLTDLYLLALAVTHQGRLVTFDREIPLSGVPGATPSNLCAA
jgi:predicted nucleic acid-binding protein